MRCGGCSTLYGRDPRQGLDRAILVSPDLEPPERVPKDGSACSFELSAGKRGFEPVLKMTRGLVDLGRWSGMSYSQLLKIRFKVVNARFNGRDAFVLWDVISVGYRQKAANHYVSANAHGLSGHDGSLMRASRRCTDDETHCRLN